MENHEREHIRLHKSKLVKEILPSISLLTRLEEQNVIGQEDAEYIKAEKIDSARSYKLLDILQTRRDAYRILLRALNEENQTGAVSILQLIPEFASKYTTSSKRSTNIFCTRPNGYIDFLYDKRDIVNWALLSFNVNLTIQRIKETDNETLYSIQENDLGQSYVSHNGRTLNIIPASERPLFEEDKEGIHSTLRWETISWGDVTPHYQIEILGRSIIFQGHKVTVKQLIKYLADATGLEQSEYLSGLTDDVLVELILDTTPKILSGNIPTLPFYINRSLSLRNRVHRRILNATKYEFTKDILLFRGIKLYELTSLVQRYGNGEVSTAGRELDNKKLDTRAILLETDSDFNKICELAEEKPVHLLQCTKSPNAGNIEKIVWLKSSGPISLIHEHIHHDQIKIQESYDLPFAHNENLYQGDTIIITGSQGMGKSHTMKKQANVVIKNSLSEERFLHYTHYISAKQFIKGVLIRQDNIELGIVDTLISTGCTTHTGKKYLQNILSDKSPINVHLFIDGIDELQLEEVALFKNAIINVIRPNNHLFKCKLWLAIRSDYLFEVESELSNLAYELMPLGEDDQVSLLEFHWNKSGASSIKMKEVAQRCLEKINRKLSEEFRNVVRTPLLCTLIAMTYEGNAIDNCDAGNELLFPRNISDSDITQIFTNYIKHVIDKHVISQTHLDKTEIESYHIEQAISLLFPDLTSEVMGLFTNNVVIDMKEMLKVGILDANSDPNNIKFYHVSLAKYLSAKALVELIKLINSQRIVIPKEDSNFTISPGSDCESLFVRFVKKILTVSEILIPLTNITTTNCGIKIYLFRQFSACYFLNSLLGHEVNYERAETIFFAHAKNSNKSLLNMLYPYVIAAIVGNLKNIAKYLLDLYCRNICQQHAKKAYRLVKSAKFKHLLFISAKFSTDALKCLCEIYNRFRRCSVSDIIFRLISNIGIYSEKRFKPIRLIHVAVEAGKYKSVRYLLFHQNFESKAIRSQLACIYDFCLLNSIRQPEIVIKGKLQILQALFISFNKSVLTYQHAAELLLEQMHLDLLKLFVELIKDMGHLKRFESNPYKDFSDNTIPGGRFRRRRTRKRRVKDVKTAPNLKSEYLPTHEIITNAYGENILHLLACKYYDENIAPQKYHATLLHLAYFIDIKTHLIARNRFHWRAIDIAASSMELLPETLYYFKQLCIDLDEPDFRGSSIIYKAIAGQRSVAALEQLLSFCQSWKTRKYLGETVMHVAAAFYNYDAIKMLYAKNPSMIYAKDHDGNTPLHVCLRKRPDPIKIQNKCENNQKLLDNNKMTSLALGESGLEKARVHNYYQVFLDLEPSYQHKIISFLIDKGAKINAKNRMRQTPLHLALQICLGGLSDDENFYLTCAIKESPDNLFQKNNLTLALKGLLLNANLGYKWHPSLISSFAGKLVEHGADIHTKEYETGASLLHLACKQHSYFGMKCLLDQFSFKVQVSDNTGRTPREFMSCHPSGCSLFNCQNIRNELYQKQFKVSEILVTIHE